MKMRTTIPAQSQTKANRRAGKTIPFLLRIFVACVLIAGPAFAAAHDAAMQTAAHPASASAHKQVHPRKRALAAVPPAQVHEQAPAPVAPQAPKPPDWPANDQPTAATVVWNRQGLHVEASNSSLGQILKDVATATGARVEGLNSDERIFGSYGPGTARDVLSQLLEGSGYNVVMIGDQGQGTPREIMLSHQTKGDAQPAANAQTPTNDENNDADEQPQPQPQQPPPPAIRNGFAPGAPPRTPQQIMQEMQQRQQQIEQMQQQNNPQR